MRAPPRVILHATGDKVRIPTGSTSLDDALGGGLRPGHLVLVEGDAGAGATEFAHAILQKAAAREDAGKVRFASALRAPERILREIADVFEGEESLPAIDVTALRGRSVEADCVNALADFDPADCLVLESAAALSRARSADVIPLIQTVGDITARIGSIVIILHARGSLPREVEANLHDVADAVFAFRWIESGPSRRMVLEIPKYRGIVPILEKEQVPVFEVALQRGSAIVISRVKSVL